MKAHKTLLGPQALLTCTPPSKLPLSRLLWSWLLCLALWFYSSTHPKYHSVPFGLFNMSLGLLMHRFLLLLPFFPTFEVYLLWKRNDLSCSFLNCSFADCFLWWSLMFLPVSTFPPKGQLIIEVETFLVLSFWWLQLLQRYSLILHQEKIQYLFVLLAAISIQCFDLQVIWVKKVMLFVSLVWEAESGNKNRNVQQTLGNGKTVSGWKGERDEKKER